MTTEAVRKLLTLTATVTHVVDDGTSDVFGDASSTTTTTEYPCWLSQSNRAENTSNTMQTSEGWTCFFPVEAFGEIGAADRVTVDGTTYEVDGPPWDATNPRTAKPSHVVVRLKRVV